MRLAALAFLALAAVAASAQAPIRPSTATGEWPTYGGDLASTKYSPLDQITRDELPTAQGRLAREVSGRGADDDHRRMAASGQRSAFDVFDELSRLDPKRWRDNAAPSIGNFKATPLMVGGALYFNTPLSVGGPVDARTGAAQWVYNPHSYEAGTTTMSLRWNQRGRRLLGRRARTSASTGAPATAISSPWTPRPAGRCRSFGDNGKRRPDGRPAAREARLRAITSTRSPTPCSRRRSSSGTS